MIKVSKIPKTCVVILGRSRSGTSLVAGCASILGVDMGQHLLPPNNNNPKGFFEELQFIELHEKMIGHWMNPILNFQNFQNEYHTLVNKFCRKQFWGVKDPRMCFIFPFFKKIANKKCEILVLNVLRPIHESVASLQVRHSELSNPHLYNICKIYDDAKQESLNLLKPKNILNIEFSSIVTKPLFEIVKMAKFLNIDLTTNKLNELRIFIDPKLKHH